ELTLQFALDRCDVGNRSASVIRSEWLQFRQIFPMVCEADRDDGKRCNAGMKVQKLLDCPIEVLAIIEPWTQHHLAMELYSRIRQPLDFLHQSIVFSITQQNGSELRFGGMNRDVQRRE